MSGGLDWFDSAVRRVERDKAEQNTGIPELRIKISAIARRITECCDCEREGLSEELDRLFDEYYELTERLRQK